MSNQTNNNLESLDRAWRVSCRKILSLPSRTHCNLIPALMNTLPPSKQINIRTVDFFKQSLNNGSTFVQFFCNNCLIEKSSIMFKNLIKISKSLNLCINDMLILPKAKVKKKMQNDISWKDNLLKELLYCRDGMLDCGFDPHMISYFINELCIF